MLSFHFRQHSARSEISRGDVEPSTKLDASMGQAYSLPVTFLIYGVLRHHMRLILAFDAERTSFRTSTYSLQTNLGHSCSPYPGLELGIS